MPRFLTLSLTSIAIRLAAAYPSFWPSQNETCALNSYTVVPDNGSGIWPYRKYKSSSATPPTFNVTSNNEDISPLPIFLSLNDGGTGGGVEQPGALIMTSDGDLVWASPNISTSNFRTQTLFGKSVMTYWSGSDQSGHGYGSVLVVDTDYSIIYTVCPDIHIYLPPGTAASCVADVHESYITENNTMLVTVYNLTQADLTSVGGPVDGWVRDPLAVEVDIQTNEVLWSWSPLAHVPINSTHSQLGTTGTNASNPFDWFHTNSIQSHEGHYLINSRNTWSSYYVMRSGEIVWEFNGMTGGDFGAPPSEAQFSWEHHVRIHNTTSNSALITLYGDNNGAPFTSNPSVALAFNLALPPNKSQIPQVSSRLVDSSDLIASYAAGSYEPLESGNVFVGYGIRPVIKEFGPRNANGSAATRWSANFGYVNNKNSAQSYRAFKQSWDATPKTRVDLIVERATTADGLTSCAKGSPWRGYVSWNGSTETVGYTIKTGNSSTDLRQTGFVRKLGFETEFVVPEHVQFVQVEAVSHSWQRGGLSRAVTVE